ncbi:MAG: peptidoglycan DD-metalloendopeptidase family protein [Chitinophagaceae bacterium]
MRYAALAFLLFLSSFSFAQQADNGRAELERRRQSILASIRESQEQLAETKKNKNTTMSQLRALQAKLDARLRLIDNINEEMRQIDGTIQNSTQEVGKLRSNLEVLKMRYAQSVRYAYTSRSSSSMLAFLFSSTDYNDAMRRLKYLKRYRTYREQQADEIRGTQKNIERKIDVLSNQKTQKNLLLGAQEQQKQVLQQETAETNGVVKELKGREKELLQDIAKNQRIAKQVDKAVAAIIAREIAEQRRKAQEEAHKKALAAAAARKAEEQRKAAAANTYGGMKVATGSSAKKPTTGPENDEKPEEVNTSSITSNTNSPRNRPTAVAVDLSLTPEAQALNNSFAANQRKLPWPVERGTITGYFGPHKHPVANVTIDNSGIDIQTSPSAAVRAVFEGTVTGIFYVPGSGQNVIITHGNYYTVYANLASVSVSKGQDVHTKQTIGTVGNNDDGLPTLNFQIWKASGNTSRKLNPSDWIAR